MKHIAYFCMEYGLESSFKQYAGGLGILAGDYLKGAYDNELPIVGIGILWKQGYTDQYIDSDGQPYDAYPNHRRNYNFLIDTEITVHVTIRSRRVACKVWKVSCFGNADLFLLDTGLAENEDAWISGQLYGWFGEERIAQEMVLGIGGIRALRALNIDIDVYHFNEGHAIFAAFELIQENMREGLSFEDALTEVRTKAVFTTHTPVKQGNEAHPLDRLLYMGADNGLSIEQLVSIGGAPFNMTVAALRLCRKANAVSRLHCETANKMWEDIDGKCAIVAITNAVHQPTWVDTQILSASEASNKALWEKHQSNKADLIKMIWERNGVQLDTERLLIGFSRRAAPYKRSNFIFSDSSIIEPLLREKKLQLVFSGKAHPLDDEGKALVAKILRAASEYPDTVVFLENYDMEIGATLTRGVDVWLNNPLRPLEACGTSGMKAAMNGVLNLSILDGWWPEVCRHGQNGWQFGNGFEASDTEVQDAHDLVSLYQVLLNEVIPTYYLNRSKWIDMMRDSIHDTKVQFSMTRMLNEYMQHLYAMKKQ